MTRYSDIKILLLGFLSGYVFSDLWHLVTVKMMGLEGQQKMFGYHFHHSLFAIVVLLVALVLYLKEKKTTQIVVFLLLVALGIVVQHRLRARCFVFIETLEGWQQRMEQKGEYF